jgi:hypothetical protein
MKKLIILTSLIMSGNLWANPMDETCVIYTKNSIIERIEEKVIAERCERNNILVVTGLNLIGAHNSVFRFCRFDRNVNTFERPNGSWMVSCVLYDKNSRESATSKFGLR